MKIASVTGLIILLSRHTGSHTTSSEEGDVRFWRVDAVTQGAHPGPHVNMQRKTTSQRGLGVLAGVSLLGQRITTF